MDIIMSNRIQKHSIKIVILYFTYRLILDITYLLLVNPIYEYSGFYLEFNAVNIISSYLILIILIMVIPKNEKRVSNMILQLHFIITIIPLTTIFAFANKSLNFMLMIFICFVMQIFFVKIFPLVKIKKIKHVKILIFSLFGIITLVTYLYLVLGQGINLNAFDTTALYKIRAEQNISGIISYFISWQYNVINPILLVIALLKKKYKMSFFVMLAQIILFMMIPHKTIILSTGLIFIVFYLTKKNYKFDSYFVLILSTVTIIFSLVYKLFSVVVPFSIFPVRFLYVPALIKFQHYDFFLINPKLFYSEGLLGKIFGIEYPYPVSSGLLIGNMVSNDNTGYLAYAYDNAGFIGMLVISFCFVLLLMIVESLVKDMDKKEVFVILVYPMLVLNDGDLLTLLLTGGFFLIIIMLATVNNFAKNKKNVPLIYKK